MTATILMLVGMMLILASPMITDLNPANFQRSFQGVSDALRRVYPVRPRDPLPGEMAGLADRLPNGDDR